MSAASVFIGLKTCQSSNLSIAIIMYTRPSLVFILHLLPLLFFLVDGGSLAIPTGKRAPAAASVARPSKTTYTGESCASTSDPALLSVCAQREQQRQSQIQQQRPKKQQAAADKTTNKKLHGSTVSKQGQRKEQVDAIKMTEGEKRAAAARQLQFEHELHLQQQEHEQHEHELQEVQTAASQVSGSVASSLFEDVAVPPSARGDGGELHAVVAPTAATVGGEETGAASVVAASVELPARVQAMAAAATTEAALHTPASAPASVSAMAAAATATSVPAPAAPTPAPACTTAAHPTPAPGYATAAHPSDTSEEVAHSNLVVEMGAGSF